MIKVRKDKTFSDLKSELIEKRMHCMWCLHNIIETFSPITKGVPAKFGITDFVLAPEHSEKDYSHHPYYHHYDIPP